MNNWQTIDTAPENGTEIELFGTNGNTFAIWGDDENAWYDQHGYRVDGATHWRPKEMPTNEWRDISSAPKDREIIIEKDGVEHIVIYSKDNCDWQDRYSNGIDEPDVWKELEGSPIKTRVMWEASNLDWDEYFKPGDEIDEMAFLYLLEIVPQRFSTEAKGILFAQAGECQYGHDGIDYYPTFSYHRESDKNFYLGNLPKFKKAKL